MRFLSFFVSFIFYFYEIYGNPIMIEVYPCKDRDSSTCTLQNIVFDEHESGKFLPKSNNPAEVTKVTFTLSKIPLLTSDLCENFPQLQILEINNVQLKRINPDALSSCTNLKEIYLQDNFLQDLDKNTFHHNKQLTKIILNNNNLKSIPIELFKDLTALTTIDLCVNRLSRLPAKTFAGLISMVNLEVRDNPLLSLEIEEMVKEMPNLKYVLNRDLDLTCNRVRQIIAFCSANGLDYYIRDDYSTYHSKSYNDYIRSRPYPVTDIDGYECLSEEQYDREVYLRETLPNLLSKHENTAVTVDFQKSFEELKEEYVRKFDDLNKEMKNSQSASFANLFEGQSFFFKLVKDKIESLESQIKILDEHIKQVTNGANLIQEYPSEIN